MDPARAVEQVREMHRLGMDGFVIHARRGLKTEYMGAAWFQCVDACLDEAEKLDMEVWLYDENGWPSGIAGGRLLEDPHNWVWYLEQRQTTCFDPTALAVFVRQPEGGYRRVETAVPGKTVYYVVYARQNSSYVDILNPDVVDRFLQETHDRYAAYYGAQFGDRLQGFFTDEPQYLRWRQPWSPMVPAAFAAAYGYDVRDGLMTLFSDEGRQVGAFRHDFWKLMNRLLTVHYQKRVYDWCEEHHCRLTGHGIEEISLEWQLIGCGGVMPLYAFAHMPGIDCLTRERDPELAARQCSSVARQLGRTQVLTETFGACGWDVSPLELKRLAESQYAAGINRMCQHLYPYSISGARKRDYPAFFSPCNPWMTAAEPFHRYFRQLGERLGCAEELADILVIHPLRTATMLYRFGSDTLHEYDARFLARVQQWRRDQLLYHFGDESLLAQYGRVEDGCLCMGVCRYHTVMLPELRTVDRTTAALLKTFLAQGGQLVILGNAPNCVDGRPADLFFLHATMTYEQLLAKRPVWVETDAPEHLHLRFQSDAGGSFVYVFNDSLTRSVHGQLYTAQPGVAMENLLQESESPADCRQEGDWWKTALCLGPAMSTIVRLGEKPGEPAVQPCAWKEFIRLSQHFSVDPDTENCLTLDRISVLVNGQVYLEETDTLSAFEQLLQDRFSGEITVCYPFTVRTLPPTLRLVAETKPGERVLINGHPVSPTGEYRLDADCTVYDIARYVQTGHNEIRITQQFWQSETVYRVLFDPDATESLRNCLTYDTELESAYLLGDFSVISHTGFRRGNHDAWVCGAGFSLAALPETVDATALVAEGFAFFSGCLGLMQDFHWEGKDRVRLHLSAHCPAVRVIVNGRLCATLLFSSDCDITAALRQGENHLRLELLTSARNLYGPFHHPQEEPYCVGPEDFGESFAGSVPILREQYAFADLSVSDVQLYRENRPLAAHEHGEIAQDAPEESPIENDPMEYENICESVSS